MTKVLIDGKAVPLSQTKTVISLNQPNPAWVSWVFRIEFVVNKAVLFVLGASALFTPNQVKESLVWIAAIDLTVWGLGRFVGLKKADFEEQ